MPVTAEHSGPTSLPSPFGRNVRGMTVGESESELCREKLPGRKESEAVPEERQPQPRGFTCVMFYILSPFFSQQ
jgi:hypothetical protein